MEQTWEEAAAMLGLEIIEWGVPGVRKKPTRLAGTVNGFDMAVETPSNSQLSAVFEKLEKVTSNTVMTSQNLTTWWVAADELTLQRGVPGSPGAFTGHVETATRTAEALSI